MVVRTVKRKEMNNITGAMKAMDDEFNKLSNVFGICGEEGSELDANDPGRKWKGRYVFRGNSVKDEHMQAAIFNELSSIPAMLEASKAVDAYGLMPGN
eukprot:6508059-Heterocapsa_arctica.AAC.1